MLAVIGNLKEINTCLGPYEMLNSVGGKSMEITNDVHQTIKSLEKNLANIFEKDTFKKFLSILSTFNNYSLNNAILILHQNPQATNVAGFQTWKKLGRYVKKGEKGIKILCPIKYNKNKDDEDDKNKTNIFFKIGNVFDISQTEVINGKNDITNVLDEFKPKILKGNNQELLEKLEKLEKISETPIIFDEIKGSNAFGYCDFANNIICVRKDIPLEQKIKTVVHEMAHSIMHKNSTLDRTEKELEAESVAFVVCNNIGIDSSEYSFNYIAGWSKEKDVKELKPLLERIHKTSAEILKKLNDVKIKIH